ncbi:hypothetical protein BCR39DRAFT_519852 [Naematelia encephala]|uniref:NAD(P)-binding protein n=1 Tax=Naematelia encephala TaxID=71784 RepID=A0A1Y2BEZ8_9TREE|nr:hypothetical protein BCR39DRAFT_519852 [Naematelia encephala]
MNKQQIRDAVLDQVTKRAKETTIGTGHLAGKVGIITGCGPEMGIGTATARLFAREGAAHLYLVDYNQEQLSSLVSTLQKTFPNTKVTYLKADAADAGAISGLVEQVLAEEGHLDFFFANAGVSQIRPRQEAKGEEMIAELKRTVRLMTHIPEDEFNEVMRINALGVFIALKYAAPALTRLCPEKGKTIPGGSLILTASVAGIKANAGPIPYSASKAAVISMAQTAAYELAGQNIRVNAICPGLIQTDMTKAAFGLAKMAGKESKMGVLNPLIRQGLGEEVAQVVLFLASDNASYVNGQAIPVDGGLSSSHPYVRAKM